MPYIMRLNYILAYVDDELFINVRIAVFLDYVCVPSPATFNQQKLIIYKFCCRHKNAVNL